MWIALNLNIPFVYFGMNKFTEPNKFSGGEIKWNFIYKI